MKKFRFAIAVALALSLLICTTACAPKYTIEFVVDNVVRHTIVTSGGETLQLPEEPQKEGYDFAGWYLDPGYWQNAFTASSYADVKLDKDIQVFARFLPRVE